MTTQVSSTTPDSGYDPWRVALNNLSPPLPQQHTFHDPVGHCVDFKWSASSRRANLQRQKTEIIADEQLNELKRKFNLDCQSIDENDAVNNLDDDSCRSATYVKQCFRPNIRPQPQGQSMGESVTDEDLETYAEIIQRGDRNIMLIWDTRKSSNKKVCKQIGNQNVVIDISFLSKACQLKDMQENSVISIEIGGEVWLEIKRRSKDMASPQQAGVNSDNRTSGCTGVSYRRSADEHIDTTDYMQSCSPDFPSKIKGFNSKDPARPSSEMSVEDNCQQQRPPSLPAKPAYLRLKIPVENGELLRRRNGTRSPEENSDDTSAFKCDNISCNCLQLNSKKCARIEENQERISMRLSNEFMRGSLDDYESLVEQLLDHESIVNFVQKVPDQVLEMSVVEWSYEENNIYENLPATVHEMEGNYSVLTPPIPPRGYHLSEIGAEEPKQSTLDKHFAGVSNGRSSNNQKDAALNVTRQPGCKPFLPVPPPRPRPNGGKPVSLLEPQNGKLPRPPRSPRSDRNISISKNINSHNSCSCNDKVCSWYRGSISGIQAKQLLDGKPDGTFLIRDASSSSTSSLQDSEVQDGKHLYTIEFIDGSQLKRIRIVKTDNSLHLNDSQERICKTLESFVERLTTSGMVIRDDADGKAWKTIKVYPYTG